MADRNVFALVLAGGEGKRLAPLTADRAKPAVPFGGMYRLVDFALSNLVNGGLLRIAVLTQYKSHSLDRHITQTWRLSPLLGNYVAPVPAQMRRGPHWFEGSADAIYQNFNLLHDEGAEHVIVVGADHIYRMDPRQMVDRHIASGAEATVAALRVPRKSAREFGVIDAQGDRIVAFLEKPDDPPGLADSPGEAHVSMGNYVFTTKALMRAVAEDAERPDSRHDIGGDIIPALVARGTAAVYDFSSNVVPGVVETECGYWRDVGTLDAYHEAHMDLVSANPGFTLHNPQWPIYSQQAARPPARFVSGPDGGGAEVHDSLVSPGAVVTGARVSRSVLAPDVRLHPGAVVERCVLMDGVEVGAGAILRGAILDKGVSVPAGGRIGVDAEADRARYTVSHHGIVVLGKRQQVLG